MSTHNVNVNDIKQLVEPQHLLNKFKASDNTLNNIKIWRNEIKNIIDGNDKRLLAIVGPCSVHNVDEALEYANRLKKLSDKYSDKIMIVMRVYFEKPRTTVGWKGLINDPDLDNSFKINLGLEKARKLLLEINNLEIPVGCEFLDTISPQYIADLVSWGAIGARTTESQNHRQLASGLSMPIGFKNGTGGSVDIAVDAISSAKSKHVFLGVDINSKASIIQTNGNPNCHIILRGSKNTPNYYESNVTDTCKLLKQNNHIPRVMVDCSHGNSQKQFKNQLIVAENVSNQLQNKNILGIMVESNINEGNQKITSNLQYGVSITDSCLNIDDTDKLLQMIYNKIN